MNERMGVVGNSGVADIIASVEDRYSIMIPLLNPDLRLSCSLKRTSYTGTLSWNDHLANPMPDYKGISFVPATRRATRWLQVAYSLFSPGLFVGTIVTPNSAC